MTAVLVVLLNISPVLSAGSNGTVYVNPSALPAQAVGTTFTVQIKVASMDLFNGWDIQVVSDLKVINGTSLSITGNIFDANTTGGSPFEIVHCVNGVGLGCKSSSDGPGIVHSAYANTAFASGNGLLFTVTYKVAWGARGDRILMQNDLISSSSPSGVPHITITGTYGFLSSGGGSGRVTEL